jgi:hypothetical protein
MTDMIAALRQVKQQEFYNMVEGNGSQPAEVVDSVIYAIREFLPLEVETRLWDEVLNWYPDYDGTDEDDD